MTVNTTYEPYSQEQEYIDTNRAFIDTLDLSRVSRVADLACGTCLLSSLLLERKPDLAIFGADISEEQLEIAKRSFDAKRVPVVGLDGFQRANGSSGGLVCLHHSSAAELPLGEQQVDLVVMGNAIHLMRDKDGFLKEVSRVIRKGGTFAFNSVFFSGTFPPGSEPIYTEWLKQAVLILNEKNQALSKAGKPPIPRVRGRGDRAFSKGWLSEQGWHDLLQRHGFTVTRSFKRELAISRRGLELVGAYGGLAEVLMSGYPVEIASECLQEAVGRAFDALKAQSVGRYWLEVNAVAS
jgi:ubiquinone/menaquinone biosynthesis C-methylase UbiE